ncbi:MAG: ABC transporter ATP-binding protein [Pseudomonadota bacterium]
MPVALHCQGLIKRYKDVLAVDGLDLSVARGECFGLLGPNGAGKTTTVEILEGLFPPDAGEVGLLGTRWGAGGDDALRARIGVQLQKTVLADRLTVTEIVRLFRSFYPRGRAVDEVIALLGLEAKRDAWFVRLSGGQQQRLALACALVGDPELLFLDEPTTGLDPQARRRIWDVIEEFRARGGTVLLTTHLMEEAERLCDRVAIMDHGRRIALGSPAELIAGLGAEQLLSVRLDGEMEEAALAALPGVRTVTRRGEEWILQVAALHEALPRLMDLVQQRGLVVVALTTRQPTLEDVFLQLTGRGLRDG